MIQSAWNSLFDALKYIGLFVVVLYYLFPDRFALRDANGNASFIVYGIIIYVFIWIVLTLAYYFLNKKTNATTESLWTVQPERLGPGTVLDINLKEKRKQGKDDLLTEGDTMDFLAETFTFSFFISLDNASIENIRGDRLKDNDTFMKLIVIPGAYSVEVDPLHETMRILFKTYQTKEYEVIIPTLKARRWNQILVTVEGRIADIYQNGILLKSVALPNVISARPGKPYLFMNADLFARFAFIQSFNRRLKEQEVIENYRINTDSLGVPFFPKPNDNFLRLPSFCIGIYCIGSQRPKGNALTTVNYDYS
jgi:preprotein translocase subunit SecG